jgi:crossover junction endodeoxyribonuclease RusA
MTNTVILPYPPAILNPNCSAHPLRLHVAKKTYMTQCWALALAAKLQAPQTGTIHMHINFYPPDRRKRDDDNAIAAFKSGRDGLAKALGVDDNRFITTHRMHADPSDCVVIHIIRNIVHGDLYA